MSNTSCRWEIRYRIAGTEYEFRGQYATKACGADVALGDYYCPKHQAVSDRQMRQAQARQEQRRLRAERNR